MAMAPWQWYASKICVNIMSGNLVGIHQFILSVNDLFGRIIRLCHGSTKGVTNRHHQQAHPNRFYI